MAICKGSNCSKKEMCKKYVKNYFVYHDAEYGQAIDWSTYGTGIMKTNDIGETYCEAKMYCGDDGNYAMIEEINWKKDYENCLSFASKYYDEETFAHAKRVTEYVKCNMLIPEEYRLDCMCLAILHDIIEDTNCNINDVPYPVDGRLQNMFIVALQTLTKEPDEDYLYYIQKIKAHTNSMWGQCAWWVKLADMKDHFAQKDRITDRLKEKYIKVLPYLL